MPVLSFGDVVVSGFSGTLAPDPAMGLPKGKSAVDLTFIDITRPAARILDVRETASAWDARVLSPGVTLDVPARDVGQVFGIALDDEPAPNVYLAATSAFGLNTVVPGRTRDAAPDRTKTGRPRAVWMEGQFGLDLQGGPGSIWKVDGATGEVSLFANVTLDGVPNPGPALGNIAYDPVHRQLFVSDLYTGMVHRFDLDGADLGHFDHGVDGRAAADLPPVAFDPTKRLDITNGAFDSEDPDTWGYAPAERRVWGLTVHEGRLYYAVAEGPQIWSVGIAADGSFAGDPRWELDLPAEPGPYPVSDMTFSSGGAMILAQRAPVTASYDYTAFTVPAEPQVLVYWPESPDDPATPSTWMPVPEEYAVGFADNSRSTDGGVDLGYAYGADGMLDAGACEASLWTTGEHLRAEPTLQDQLLPGGPLPVDGLQVSPADQVRNANTPPWLSAFIDYDDAFDAVTDTGHMGVVRVLKAPCEGLTGVYGGPPYVPNPPYTGDGGDGGGGGGGDCTTDNSCTNITPIDLSIKKTAGAVTYDAASGTWTVQFTLVVTNTGNSFTPQNLISIHDAIPSGMAVLSAAGAGWSACTGNLDCGFNYSGVFASGATLPPLVITLVTKEPGKYENCATVGVPMGSGLQETTLANNRDCAVVEIVEEPKACFASKGSFECDTKTGQWVYQLSVSGPAWLNAVSAVSLTPGVSVSAGPLSLSPAGISVTGPPGLSAIIDVCGFDAAAELSGKPYDCCHSRLNVTIPDDKLCEKQP